MRHVVRRGFYCLFAVVIASVLLSGIDSLAQQAGGPSGQSVPPCSGTYQYNEAQPCGASTPPAANGGQAGCGNLGYQNCGGSYFIDNNTTFITKCRAANPAIRTENCQPMMQPKDFNNPNGEQVESVNACGSGGTCMRDNTNGTCYNGPGSTKFSVVYGTGPASCYVR